MQNHTTDAPPDKSENRSSDNCAMKNGVVAETEEAASSGTATASTPPVLPAGGNRSSTERESSPSSGNALADSEGPEEDEEGLRRQPGAQCEVCMAENWWRMAALQHRGLKSEENGGDSSSSSDDPQMATSKAGKAGLPELDLIDIAAMMMFYSPNGMDFSMTKLRAFYESQRSEGVPDFPEDFDEFWLLVVKARLFNVFRRKGPVVYNRIVLKIRDTVQKFMARVEERERREALERGTSEEPPPPPPQTTIDPCEVD